MVKLYCQFQKEVRIGFSFRVQCLMQRRIQYFIILLIVFILISDCTQMDHDSFDKQMSMTNKKDKIFNVRKLHYKQFDHQKYLKPTYTPFQIKDHTEGPSSSKISRKGGEFNYQVAIVSSPAYKELVKKLYQVKEQYNRQKQRRLQQLRLKDQQLNKIKAEKERIDSQRIKIIQRRDELRSKIEQIRERNEILKNQQMLRREQYRLMNMEYLRNMIIGIKYQNGMELDVDNMTYEQLLELEEKIGSVSKGLSQDQIQKLPTKVYKQNEPEQLCSVCYYNAKPGEQMTVLPCSHSFHTQCIKQWLLKEKMCPMCKQQIITKIKSSQKISMGSQEQKIKSTESIFQEIDLIQSDQLLKNLNEQEKAENQLLKISGGV